MEDISARVEMYNHLPIHFSQLHVTSTDSIPNSGPEQYKVLGDLSARLRRGMAFILGSIKNDPGGDVEVAS